MASFTPRLRRLGRKPPTGTIAVLALAGLALCSCGGPSADILPPHPPTVSPASVRPGSTRPDVATPHDFQSTEEGTIVAALVTDGQAVLDMEAADAERTVRANAPAGTADAQAVDLRERLAAIRRAPSACIPVIGYGEVALVTRLQAFHAQRAQVAGWHEAVLSRTGVASPQAGWAVSIVDLAWDPDDWKLESESVTPRPTQIRDASRPTTAERFDAALDGFSARDWR